MEDNKGQIIAHVGMHKTGTTFLQKDVFPYIENIKYYNYEESKAVADGILGLPAEPTETILISWEGFSFKGLWERYAYQLKALGVTKIIIGTVHDTEEWHNSLYAQYVMSGGHLSYRNWEKKERPQDYTNFGHRWAKYIRIFGFENIFVYNKKNLNTFTLGEMIKFIGGERSGEIDTFRKRNVSIKGRKLNLLRTSNWICYKVRSNLRRLLQNTLKLFTL